MPQFAANLNLSSLDGSNGFQINGEAAGDYCGIVAYAGDVNGDGFDDVIVGAYTAGASYVIFGKASGFTANFDLSKLDGNNGFQINGEARGDQSGFSVSTAGDVNGDGFDDFIVGARWAGPHGFQSGASYVIFGKASGFKPNLDLKSLNGNNGFQISGESEGDNSGNSVSSAGDVNGDGFDDVIVGAQLAEPNGEWSGASYVVFGKSGGFTANIDLSALDGSNGFQISGEAKFDVSGSSVSSAGDVNGDGLDDLIIGASQADPNGSSSGASYVVFGKAGGFAANLNLSSLNGNNGFRISGEAPGDRSGISVSSAGDVNGDGFDDLIVGANLAAPNGYRSGASYVVFGKASGFAANLNLSALNGNNGFQISGKANEDLSGTSVSSAGDVNGDGFDDLIVGAGQADPHGSDSGASYVVFGKAGGFAANLNLSALNGNNGFQISGEADSDLSGFSVSSAGDVNGDGFDDLMVGAVGADPNGDHSGACYVIFGHRALTAVTIFGTDIAQISNGGRGNDSISGFGGDDRLIGWEGADTLLGGDGNDREFGGAGDDILLGGKGKDILDGSIGADALTGSGGNDTLSGGGNNDILTGGSGDDLFRYVAINDGGDRINDFSGRNDAGRDRIDVSAIDATAGGADNAFVFGRTTATEHGVWYSTAPNKVTLFADTDGNAATAEFTITLIGVSGLIQSDFIL